ncbi:DUF5672 family protein [uncultured Moraxella sp.]|uniref:DUF5672 family protein n=1 Tax=uncultured Moraxella sp. TaxID=263769 RepID=UPI0025D1AD56|nr:DUF5672 family protein [uncultured Moraxella sp.]
MSQKSTPSITIISVTGHQDYAQGSVYAIERSYTELQKKLPKDSLSCILVSPDKPEHLPEHIMHLVCKPFSYLEYNLFILYALDQLVETDFALIVQNDGFVVDGDNWRDEFFEYDYIGAPVYGLYEVLDDGTAKNHQGDACDEYLRDMPPNFIDVQNGGFSLRSKKLLGMPRKLGIKWQVNIPKFFSAQPLSLDFESISHNEDMYLCVMIRKILEAQGLRFAPVETACYFACESTTVHNALDIPLNQVLGCHAFGLLVLTDTQTLYMAKKMNMIDNNPATNALCRWLLGTDLSINVPKAFLQSDD